MLGKVTPRIVKGVYVSVLYTDGSFHTEQFSVKDYTNPLEQARQYADHRLDDDAFRSVKIYKVYAQLGERVEVKVNHG